MREMITVPKPYYKSQEPIASNGKNHNNSSKGGSVSVWGSTSLQTSLTHSAAYQSAPMAR